MISRVRPGVRWKTVIRTLEAFAHCLFEVFQECLDRFCGLIGSFDLWNVTAIGNDAGLNAGHLLLEPVGVIACHSVDADECGGAGARSRLCAWGRSIAFAVGDWGLARRAGKMWRSLSGRWSGSR